MRGRKTAANCESCMNYEYDDDYECYSLYAGSG